MKLDSKALRLYGQQVGQQIDEYADRFAELEEENASLRSEIVARDFTIDEMCDEIHDLQQQLEGVKQCA